MDNGSKLSIEYTARSLSLLLSHRSVYINEWPTLPDIDEQVTPKEDEEVVDSDSKNESLQVEVPFVPAAQRLKREDVDDSLVVVGQSKQKKRKRTGGAEQSTSKKPKSVSGSEEPFDFSSVPNVLDQLPDTQEDTRVKKKGKQKKGTQGFLDIGRLLIVFVQVVLVTRTGTSLRRLKRRAS